MFSRLGRLNRSAKHNAMTALLARHRAIVAADIAEAIEESVPGHSYGNECDGLQPCNVCARRRQAQADAATARRIGETRAPAGLEHAAATP